MSAQKTTVPVSERAVIQRVNREVGRNDGALRAARGAKAEQELGRAHIVDLRRNSFVEKDCDPETIARTLGVLREWEHVSRTPGST
jgi:hypothetical protein